MVFFRNFFFLKKVSTLDLSPLPPIDSCKQKYVSPRARSLIKFNDIWTIESTGFSVENHQLINLIKKIDSSSTKITVLIATGKLQIHLILIRILDPHWKKMDPDPNPGHFLIYWIFLTIDNFQIFCFIFFAYFYPKTYAPFRNEEIFILSLFTKSSDLGFRSKKGFFFSFC